MLRRTSAFTAAACAWSMSAAAGATETSTVSGGLFSDEEIPDAAPATGAPTAGLETAPELDAAETPSFIPSVVGHVRLDAELTSDTSFDRQGEHIFELALGGRIELNAELTRALSVFAAPSFTHVSAIDREGGDRSLLYLDVPEAYATWSSGAFHLRTGTLIFSWGSSDIIAPSDVLNPLDLRRTALGSSEEVKVPILAAEAVLALSPLTLRGVVAPVFTPSRFHLTGWDRALSLVAASQGLVLPDLDAFVGAPTADRIGDQLLLLDRPSDRPDNATLALRATLGLDAIDLSGTFVYGWEALPRLRLDRDLLLLAEKFGDSFVGGQPLDITDPEVLGAIGRIQDALAEGRDLIEGGYQRRTVVGADLSWAVDPIIVKLDVAYSFSRTLYTQAFNPVSLPWLNAVIGAEYVDGERLQVIVEAFAITIFDVGSSYRLMLIEPRSAPPEAAPGSTRRVHIGGVAGVVRYSVLQGDLMFEVAGLSAFTRGDLFVLPTIRWRIDDRHQLRIGGALLEGPKDGYGGIYTHTDRVFVGYRWTP